MGFSAVDIFVNDTTPTQSPVAGVTVKVLSQNGKITYTLTSTDANGHAGFLLPDTLTYQLRLYKFGVSFDQPLLFTVLPEPLTAGQTNAFNVPAVLVTPPVPNDVRLCTAYGFFRDLTGAPDANVQIHFIAKFDPVWLDGSAVTAERMVVQTDCRGYVQLNLIRNGQYECTVQGEEDLTRLISVPDAPNVNIADLIFPVVQQAVATPPGPYTIAVGETLNLDLVFFGSDGENLGLGIGDVRFATNDQSIANYALINPTGISLIGVGPGTTQIVFTRADPSIVRIPDAGILGSPLTVTVTA